MGDDRNEADAREFLHEQISKAGLYWQRLRTILPRLQKRYHQVADAEEYAAWATTFDRLKPKHSAAAAKLKTIYIEFEAKVVEALTEAKQVDAEVQFVMHRKPYHLWESNNDGRGLPTVEAAARGLKGVSSDYSLMSMKIPVFNSANQLAWPPPQIPLAVQVARSMVPVPGDPRQFTNRWHEVAAEKAQAARQQRLREQQEEQARIDVDPRADQWWKVQSA